MEEAAVIGMSTTMMLMIGVLMFLFRKAIFRAAELSEVTVTRILDGVDDSSGTYVAKLHVLNAQTRAEIAKEISDIDILVSNDDIMNMLKAKQAEAKAKPAA